MNKTKKIVLSTKGYNDMVDITGEIEAFVRESGVSDGAVSVFVRGSTGAVSAIEFEPNLVKDFKEAMERFAPSNKTYHHKKTWNDDNGFSHVRASLVGPSEVVPVSGGRLIIGTWQQIVVIDFDTGPRKREVFLTVLG
ncbi:MAG: secondary thiamine-phosphate synthase enzyme YjbQ [Elusimicrobiota bacterium]